MARRERVWCAVCLLALTLVTTACDDDSTAPDEASLHVEFLAPSTQGAVVLSLVGSGIRDVIPAHGEHRVFARDTDDGMRVVVLGAIGPGPIVGIVSERGASEYTAELEQVVATDNTVRSDLSPYALAVISAEP